MRRSLVSSATACLVALAACTSRETARDAAPEPNFERPPPPEPAPIVGLDLSWSMRRVGDKLHLTYTITNRTDHAIRVFDHFADHERERIVVHNDDYLLATVAFTHGYVDHRTADKHAGESVGRMRRLDAGSSVDGAAVVPIPLEAWLDYYTIRPLELGITHAVVEVDVCLPFRSEFLDRIRGPSPPQPHAVVGPCSPQALRGERLALPEGAMSWIPRPPSIEWYDYEQAMRRIDRNNRERYRRARERDAGRR